MGEYSLNLKNREVLHIVSRTETDSASMGLGGVIREIAESKMPGTSQPEQAQRLDAAVNAGRVIVELTEAGIELYNFPTSSRAKGVTISNQVGAESRGAVSSALAAATMRGISNSGISLSALAPSGSGSAALSIGDTERRGPAVAGDTEWNWWSQSHVALEKTVRDSGKFYDKATHEPSTPAADTALERLVELITVVEDHQLESRKISRSKKDPLTNAQMTKARAKECGVSRTHDYV